MADMSESSEYLGDTTTPVAAADVVTDRPVLIAEPVVAAAKPNRLYQAAAWVAIVAGTLFIVSTIFFAGFMLGKNGGGHGPFRHGGADHGMMMDRSGPPMGPWMHRDGGPGPGNFGPGGPGGPGQPPQAPPSR